MNDFFTFRGNEANVENQLTPAMEDYLEMICRLLHESKVVRTKDLSQMLHVKPSSASRMIQLLNDSGYIISEKYGYILVTEKGRAEGEYFLYRHEVLERFLKVLNQSEEHVLEQVEKIEHFLERGTIANLNELTKRMLEYQK